ncbi:MAG: hypothetical protein IMZ43_06355 [Thermoplasmata archaeon]|nr:hypothetical protein [Thermoplasmata archaeon]MBE3136997.1 hypothetical protein [Thermoplasmata archaeon]
MNKKIVIVSLLTALLVSLTSITPALATKNTNLITLKNDLVTIEVNRYLGKTPEQIHTTVTSAEAEQIKQDLMALYDAQQRNDHEAISKYEVLLNEKGIFGNSNQKFYSNDNGMALIEKTKFSRYLTNQIGENISNRFCYFNAIGEGLVFWWLALSFLQGIVNVLKNVTNPIAMLILLLVLLPLAIVMMLLTNLIPFRILAPTGAMSLKNGTISCLGLNGFQRVKVGAEAYGVNLSWFTGITINIPPINNRTAFLFVSGIALKAEGVWT